MLAMLKRKRERNIESKGCWIYPWVKKWLSWRSVSTNLSLAEATEGSSWISPAVLVCLRMVNQVKSKICKNKPLVRVQFVPSKNKEGLSSKIASKIA